VANRAGHRGCVSRNRKLSLGIGKIIRHAQREKSVTAIVHNRRDRADACHLHRIERVFDHPLSFLSAAEIDIIRRQSTRRQFPLLDAVPSDTKLIGVFGFLSDYKGFETVIRALHHLPKDHHLLIFGGTHPNEIPLQQAIHPYIAKLLDAANVDAPLHGQPQSSRPTIDREREFAELFAPRDLSNRLHFMGALSDSDFLAGMAICDVVVLPYLEVGQSSSGSISQAVELGCRVIASRTHAFLGFATYHPERVEFFDIGNHLELAKRIAARPQTIEHQQTLNYNIDTNKAVYLAANTMPGNMSRRFHRTPLHTASHAVVAAEH
jgi:glycosyltransferase involved in cell wall biosynthesis